LSIHQLSAEPTTPSTQQQISIHFAHTPDSIIDREIAMILTTLVLSICTMCDVFIDGIRR
jgi:hypothetical protein